MAKKVIQQTLGVLAIVILVVCVFTFIYKNKLENLGITKKNMKQEKNVRLPAVSGAFYDSSKEILEKKINYFLSQTKSKKVEGRPRIIIVPHAGYDYSGQVAAYAFKALDNFNFSKAIIIGPSHNYPVSGLFLSKATHWQTPLGLVEVDKVNLTLAQENDFEINEEIHKPEHSIEVEVPFLQTVLPEAKIIPIIVGQLNENQITNFVKLLDKYLDDNTVLIVSVDLSHYHSYQEALDIDKESIQNILNLNSKDILRDEIDAPWAVSAVLELAKLRDYKAQLLNSTNSGDITGDKTRVVGYSSFVFTGEEKNMTNQDFYTEGEKIELLKISRITIDKYLRTGEIYEPETTNEKFLQKRGVFVTLNKENKLRGCIGYIEPIKPLVEAIRDNAISAAVEDNRFNPVEIGELNDLEIEISILTVPKPDSLENITNKKLGVVLRQGNYGATYLPQVWESFNDSNQFWSSLCKKAGLDSACYLNKQTEFLSYQATVFSE